MRSFAFIVGLTAASMSSQSFAMTAPSERIIAEGKIVNVDEKNSSFEVLAADGGRTRVFTPKPVLIVIKDQQDFAYQGTWDDVRRISVSGRITGIAVDPGESHLSQPIAIFEVADLALQAAADACPLCR